MNSEHHTQSHMLVKYSFWWSEARLAIAAVALFIGGNSPVRLITPPIIAGLVVTLLNLSWIISGVVSGYLLYRWFTARQMLFGRHDTMDTIAFFVNIVSGFNLGLAGLTQNNIGMGISSNRVVFVVVGLLYLASAYRLFERWNASGKKIFH